MTNAEIRQLLMRDLGTDDALKTFLLDHFPKVARECTPSMTTTAQHNLLIQCHQPDEIGDALRKWLSKSPPPPPPPWLPQDFTADLLSRKQELVLRASVSGSWHKIQAIYLAVSETKSWEFMINGIDLELYITGDRKLQLPYKNIRLVVGDRKTTFYPLPKAGTEDFRILHRRTSFDFQFRIYAGTSFQLQNDTITRVLYDIGGVGSFTVGPPALHNLCVLSYIDKPDLHTQLFYFLGCTK